MEAPNEMTDEELDTNIAQCRSIITEAYTDLDKLLIELEKRRVG